MARFHVLIPAAGSGSRMASELPKQYLSLLGEPLLTHTVRLFTQSEQIASVHVLVSEQDTHWLQLMFPSKVQVHPQGGETRAQTVLNGLRCMQGQVAEDDWVLVHDAARPGLTLALLHQLIETLEHDAVGGLLALPLADTLKRSDHNGCVVETISREALWQAQTPQMFRYTLLKIALENFKGQATDEAQAVEALGFAPKLVVGALRNMKITYPQDLALLNIIMQQEGAQ
ncbi:MAG: 2-C-methyl-D-erythritol 4-phosphate cytidylyltransferase [Methylotenera sp.]|nr:2-C-methyl-D-erythritol 4-phosphate cytidylyltransferase [Methylotenera sp.]